MKRVEVKRADGVVRIYAVNGERQGLFARGEHEGAYSQTQGTGQYSTPSLARFLADLRHWGAIRPGDEVVDFFGWEEAELGDPTALTRQLGKGWETAVQ